MTNAQPRTGLECSGVTLEDVSVMDMAELEQLSQDFMKNIKNFPELAQLMGDIASRLESLKVNPGPRKPSVVMANVDSDDEDDDEPLFHPDPEVRKRQQAADRVARLANRSARANAAANRPAPAPGTAAASGQIAASSTKKPAKKQPKQPKPRKSPEMATDKTLPKNFSRSDFERQLTSLPLWQVANTGLAAAGFEEYPEPPAEQTSLHRRICGNMSRFMGDDPRNIGIAAIAMELCTKVPKMAKVFGTDQIPVAHGGGPYYLWGKTYSPPPVKYEEHEECTVKGITQVSKSPEQSFDAWGTWFVEGKFPVLFIRLKGGGMVGTADAEDAVTKINKEVVETWERIKHKYPGVELDAADLSLVPKCASRQETISMRGNGSYRLTQPQCLIACTGATQLRPFYQKPELTTAAASRALSQGQPLLPYLTIFGGGRLQKDPESANPYLPSIDDPALLGCGDGRGRLRPAIKAIFDEDDQNRSGTGNEAKDVALFQKVTSANKELAELQRLTASAFADDDDDAASVDSAADQALADAYNTAEFYKDFRVGLRAYFGTVTAYSATPTTAVYAIGTEDRKCSEVRTHMIEVRPSKCYIGYPTEHHMRTAPWCTKHIRIRRLEDRQAAKKHAMKDLYPKAFMQMCGVDIEQEGVPEPFKQNVHGDIRLGKNNVDDEVAAGNGQVRAGAVRDNVKRAMKGGGKAKQNFWYEDGNNLVSMLEDMEVNRAEYPDGYRNALVMSNHTNTHKGKENFVSTTLGLSNSPGTDGACPDTDLVNDLIMVEWTDKYVRFSWIPGEVDVPALQEACAEIAEGRNLTLDGNAVSAVEAMQFAKSAEWMLGDEEPPDADGAVDEENQGESVTFRVSNINYAYSLLWKYKEAMEQKREGEGFFVKFLLFVGEIGGRGARYKTHDKHQFVLTDMLYSFSVKLSGQILTHAAAAIQAVGRLCTLVVDIDAAPPITLWTPGACWAYIEHWMNVMNELPDFFRMRNPDENLDELLERICLAADGLGCPAIRKHFGAITGMGKNGTKYFARLDHQLRKAKQVAKEMHEACEEAGSVPETIPIEDHSEEINSQHATKCMEIAIARGDEIDAVDPDDFDEDEEEEETKRRFAALGAPTVHGGRSVPLPHAVNVRYSTKAKRGRGGRGGRKGKQNKDIYNYNWHPDDTTVAFNSIKALTTLRESHPVGKKVEDIEPREFMEMFVHWYVYFIHMENASMGPGDNPSENEFGHGLRTHGSRTNYSRALLNLLQPMGRAVFTDFTKLPMSDDPTERVRVAAFCGQYATLCGQDATPGSYNGKGTKSKHQQFAANMGSYLSKWMQLFPRMDAAGGIHRWLIDTPIPGPATPPARGGRPAPFEDLGNMDGGVVELDSDDEVLSPPPRKRRRVHFNPWAADGPREEGMSDEEETALDRRRLLLAGHDGLVRHGHELARKERGHGIANAQEVERVGP